MPKIWLRSFTHSRVEHHLHESTRVSSLSFHFLRCTIKQLPLSTPSAQSWTSEGIAGNTPLRPPSFFENIFQEMKKSSTILPNSLQPSSTIPGWGPQTPHAMGAKVYREIPTWVVFRQFLSIPYNSCPVVHMARNKRLCTFRAKKLILPLCATTSCRAGKDGVRGEIAGRIILLVSRIINILSSWGGGERQKLCSDGMGRVPTAREILVCTELKKVYEKLAIHASLAMVRAEGVHRGLLFLLLIVI